MYGVTRFKNISGQNFTDFTPLNKGLIENKGIKIEAYLRIVWV